MFRFHLGWYAWVLQGKEMNPTPTEQGTASMDRTMEICKQFELGEEAQPLLQPGLVPRQFLLQLVEKELWTDGLFFLAHALPKRESIWWGYQCVQQILQDQQTPAQANAMQAIHQWLLQPEETQRRACFPAAEKADFGSPAGCLAMAAFWSGGSISPPEYTAVSPAEELTGNAVASALLMAAAVQEPEKAPEKYKQFFAVGEAVATGQSKPWAN